MRSSCKKMARAADGSKQEGQDETQEGMGSRSYRTLEVHKKSLILFKVSWETSGAFQQVS